MPVYENILDLHQRRAASSIARVLESYVNGEITHESDLLAALTEEYANLYATLTDPLITPEPMRVGELLRVSAIRTPMIQLDEDLDTAFSQLQRLHDAVVAITNLCAVERAGLDELLAQARDRVVEAKAWSSDSDPTFLWASDTFKTTTRVSTQATSARIDTKLGVVTLGVDGEESLASKVSKVSIAHVGADSKYLEGMPGNWLEVKTSSSGPAVDEVTEPVAPVFTGQTYKPSYSPAGMFDGDPSTWFEWERYLVPSSQRLTKRGFAWVVSSGTTGEVVSVFGAQGITNDYGWEYTIHWPDEEATEDARHWIVTPQPTDDPAGDHMLRMHVSIDFESPQPLSWFEMLPYFSGGTVRSDADRTAGFRLASLQASADGTTAWTELVQTPIDLTAALDQPIDAIHAGIPVKDYRGTAVVPCPLSRVKSVKMELVQDGPYPTIIAHKFHIKKTQVNTKSSSWFGLKKSSSTSIQYSRVQETTLNPTQDGGKIFLGWGSTTSKTDLEIDTFYDIIKSYRYAIGVRDLGLFQRLYAPASQVVSRPLIFEKSVVAASLIVGEHIPEGWSSDTRWIRYEISPDGTNWIEIIPQNTDGSVGAVVRFDPTNRLYVRATLTRPADKPGESPVLEYYAVKAIPEGTV